MQGMVNICEPPEPATCFGLDPTYASRRLRSGFDFGVFLLLDGLRTNANEAHPPGVLFKLVIKYYYYETDESAVCYTDK